jgi:SAM-dependent methyltransferase
MKQFDKQLLKDKYLLELLKDFWFSPCDAFLRAPEIGIWQSLKIKKPILDIGCGDGRIDKHLFKGYSIDYGLDPNKNEILRAKSSGLYKHLLIAGAEKIPLENQHFNTVICNSTFEHIKFDKKALSEISRILKPKGELVFTTTTDILLKYLKEIGVTGSELVKYNHRVSHYHYHSINEWKNMLNNNNFEIIDYCFYFPKKLVSIWYWLFKITTFKIYHRELWSYLKDSKYGKILPSIIIYKLWYLILHKSYKRAFDKDGCWLFIRARKI